MAVCGPEPTLMQNHNRNLLDMIAQGARKCLLSTHTHAERGCNQGGIKENLCSNSNGLQGFGLLQRACLICKCQNVLLPCVFFVSLLV